MLGVFWFHAQEISFNACLVQMYFIHVFSIIESAVLLAMAFDRLVAIREPLRYATILTNDVIIGIALVIAGRALALVFPASFLLKKLQYHPVNVLSYPFCLHQDLIKTTVSSRRVSSIYGLMVVICSMGLDSVLLLLSYILILGTVLSIASMTERMKALNTCISHICAVLTFYTPMIGLSMIHRYGKHASPIVHVLMANVYLLVPPFMNPIVYSVKTKQIRDRILKKFKQQKV
ncbi:Olfactory receptor 51G2 [Camelus dromedarius]|uniref:Olfactory receptor 51G2 n=1 Tax=Camelus dromedarius TaxID=9838 RepID=A0A5N4DNM6_CAMDR|nr:Olfactory receptor 51G2 [Camelus dromedarius]